MKTKKWPGSLNDEEKIKTRQKVDLLVVFHKKDIQLVANLDSRLKAHKGLELSLKMSYTAKSANPPKILPFGGIL